MPKGNSKGYGSLTKVKAHTRGGKTVKAHTRIKSTSGVAPSLKMKLAKRAGKRSAKIREVRAAALSGRYNPYRSY